MDPVEIKDVYSRMTLNSEHMWMRHTAHEVDLIIETLLQENTEFLDIGCGIGRHTLELGNRGFNGTGIDFSSQLIEKALLSKNQKVHFIHGDARSIDLGRTFHAIFCLYDVIGSFSEESDNDAIIKNLARHLAPGGSVLISVMNRELTEFQARHKINIRENPEATNLLLPSNTMQKTGNIFDPDFYIADPVTGIVYRKEVFLTEAGETEVIVQDRRYFKTELVAKLAGEGIEEIWTRYVQSGRWQTNLPPTDKRAKEILFYGKREG